MNTYKLLTPGPLTTTDTVKEEMLVDRCTWDDDYKAVTQKIRRQLLQLGHVSEDDYTVVLMQGSGTFGVESVLSSVVGDEDKVLICSNGAYGVRMTQICDRNRIPYVHYAEHYDRIPDPARVAQLLAQDPAITHVAMVHSETTSGILNDIQSVGKVVRDAGRTFIVDAMSSFGGVDIPVSDWGIDFLVSSANKCIQGVPGFSFILCRRDKLAGERGQGPLPVPGPAGPVEGDGEGRQVALHLPHPRGAGLLQGPGRAGGGGGHPRPAPPLRGEQPPAH